MKFGKGGSWGLSPPNMAAIALATSCPAEVLVRIEPGGGMEKGGGGREEGAEVRERHEENGYRRV